MDELTEAELRVQVERLGGLVEEYGEKIAFLRNGCANLDRDELIQRITAVGPEEWTAGDWLAKREAPLRLALLHAETRAEELAGDKRRAPVVELTEELGQPTRCKVWRFGRLVFEGEASIASQLLARPIGYPDGHQA